MSDSAASTIPNAGVWRRLGAMLYDGMLLFGVLFVATAIAAAFTGGISAEQQLANGDVVHEISPALQGVGFQLYLLVITALFFSVFWRKDGQTLGMQAWRLRLQDSEGNVPSWKQCGLRLLVAPVSLLCGGLGYWWIWVDKQNRSWHDRVSGTFVVVLPKKRK